MSNQYERIAQDADRVSPLTRDEMGSLLVQAEERFGLEQNLVRLGSGRAIFVGDTHGDFDASKKVIAGYPGVCDRHANYWLRVYGLERDGERRDARATELL